MTTTTTTPATTKTAKAPRPKSTKPKTERFSARFTKDGKTLGLGVNGNRLSSFVLNGEERTKGKVVVLDVANGSPKEQFDKACEKAIASGWSPAKKEFTVDDLIALD